ncbi:Uncharacterised protein [Mycobacteroides abscessus subsp. abscessus]|nr:Uncharacterised protein [Mycobacteroides abscessus subsp. abscessus]
MIREKVQRVEVVVLGFYLGSLGDLPAHADENVGDLLGDHCDGMARSTGTSTTRQRDVDRLGDENRGVALGLQLRRPAVEDRTDPPTNLVDQFACFGSLVLRQRTQSSTSERYRRTIAEVRGLGGRERIEISGRSECRSGGVGRGVEFLGAGERWLRLIVGRAGHGRRSPSACWCG